MVVVELCLAAKAALTLWTFSSYYWTREAEEPSSVDAVRVRAKRSCRVCCWGPAPAICPPGCTEIGSLGRGGFGEVLLVQRGGSRYALKQVGYVERMALEALTGHPNIVHLVEILEAQDRSKPFLLMEVLRQDLHRFASPRLPLHPHEAYTIVEQVASALAWVHDRGWLYLDISPGNAMRSAEGQWKLLDFGLARRVRSEMYVKLQGTKHFVAPEVIAGDHVGYSTDSWGLGILLYWLVVGSYPFWA